MKQLLIIGPELFIAVLAMVVLCGETFLPKVRRGWLYLSIAGLLGVLGYEIQALANNALPGAAAVGVTALEGSTAVYHAFSNMVVVDPLSAFFKIALAVAVILVLWMSLDYPEFETAPMGTYAGLLLLATVGMMLLVSSWDLLLAILALELLSLASFVLTGFIPARKSSHEGAFKFFLVGSFSSAIFLYGLSFYYAMFGTTNMAPLIEMASHGSRPEMILVLTLVFLLAGLGFKLAMVPFHMWAPDAYEGAPTPITAFLSVAPKTAAIGFVLRFLSQHEALNLTPVLAVVAALTMTVGNIGALFQTNLKRLLAYSSIAQVGYILVAFVASGPMGTYATMLYTFVYLFMNMGVFAVLLMLANRSKSEEITGFSGLYQKSLPLSLIMFVFLLSMSGIPPLAGFIGKVSIFGAVIVKPSLLWLAVVAVLNSVISLFYYFRIVQQMFFKEPGDTFTPLPSPALLSCMVVALAITVVGGLLPDCILGWIRNVVAS